MIYEIINKYFTVTQDKNNSIQTGGSKAATSKPFFQSDILQEVIDNFISNDILNFAIPVEITKPDNVPYYYLNDVYSNNILTKYIDGIGVFSDNILTSYVEMSEDEKLTIGLERKKKALKWVYPECPFRFKLLTTETYANGSFAHKNDELRANETMSCRVDIHHNRDAKKKTYTDIYFEELSKEGIVLIAEYVESIAKSEFQDLNGL